MTKHSKTCIRLQRPVSNITSHQAIALERQTLVHAERTHNSGKKRGGDLFICPENSPGFLMLLFSFLQIQIQQNELQQLYEVISQARIGHREHPENPWWHGKLSDQECWPKLKMLADCLLSARSTSERKERRKARDKLFLFFSPRKDCL